MKDMARRLNFVYFTSAPFPRGMAGTARGRHTLDGLRAIEGSALRVLTLSPNAPLNPREGEYNGVPFRSLRGKMSLASVFGASRRAIAELKGAWKEGATNVVYHYDYPRVDTILPLLWAHQAGYKVVVEFIEDNNLALQLPSHRPYRLKLWLSILFGARLCWYADGVVVISRALEQKFAKLTRGRIPMVYCPISVDLGCFRGEVPRKAGSEVTLFYAGSFGIKDGLFVLLEAFEKLRPRHSNLRLQLCGKGTAKQEGELRRRLERGACATAVTFLGYLNDEDYYRELRQADIHLMTRVNIPYANAGFPFKLGEYLATGKPVVASKVSCVTEYLADDVNAKLVEGGDAGALECAIEDLLANPEKAKRIGAAGQLVVREHFEMEKQGRDLARFFDRLA